MYNAVILFTISDDDLRKNFCDALEADGFKKQKDQSTYSFPTKEGGVRFSIDRFTQWLNLWGKKRAWKKTDFIHVFYLDFVSPESKAMAIFSKKFTVK